MFFVFRFFWQLFCRIFQYVIFYAEKLFDWSPPKLLEGPDSLLKLPKFLKDKGYKKPLIVTGPCITKLKLCEPFLKKLQAEGLGYAYFDDVQPNPIIKNIEDARKMYLENQCDMIVSIGGGSAMDCAKVCACRIARPNTPVTWLAGLLRVLVRLPLIVAVPTTAGTGSETTIAAVVVNPENHKKFSILDFRIKPPYAVLDPKLTTSLPKHITSTTGMDALTHAIEAYIGNANVSTTIEYAETAVKLIFDNLEKAYNDGSNVETRMNMLKASFNAGLAFTRAFVGYVHSIAHQLGGIYNIPHGYANAIILPYVLEYYGQIIYPKLARLYDVAGLDSRGINAKSVDEKAKAFIQEIKNMNKRMNIPAQFDIIKERDIGTIISRALAEANPLYPVPKIMDSKECNELIRKMSSSNL